MPALVINNSHNLGTVQQIYFDFGLKYQIEIFTFCFVIRDQVVFDRAVRQTQQD